MSKSRERRLTVQKLEDRTAPAVFGPIDDAVPLPPATSGAAANPYGLAVIHDPFGTSNLVVAERGANQLEFLNNHGGSTFTGGALSFSGGSGPFDIVVGDLFKDNSTAIAVANVNSANVTVYDDRSGTSMTYPVGLGPTSIAAGDFNRDGITDLAVANSSDHTVSVLLGNGLRSFAFPSTVNVGGSHGPRSLVVGDFNGDQIPDLALTTGDSNSVIMLTGNGDATFRVGTPITVDAGPVGLAVGDFNNDGHPDLAVGDYVAGEIQILLGNGTGGFSFGQKYSAGVGVNRVTAADLNGDGYLDLVSVNELSASNNMQVLMGNGNGTFFPTAGSRFTTGNGPETVVVDDFNADGHPDLAVSNSFSNNVVVFLNHGATTTTLTTAGGQLTYGQPVTLSATVTTADGAVTSGTVGFYSGSNLLAAVFVTNGVASWTGDLPAGNYNIVAKYVSYDYDASNSSAVALTVNKAPTTTTLLPPANVLTGKAYTLSAAVDGLQVLGTTGGVVFRDGTTILGGAPLTGNTATMPVMFSSGGTHNLTATFIGDGNFQGSTSQLAPVTPVGSAKRYAVGAGPGDKPEVKVYNLDGTVAYDFLAYATTFTGGVRVATADVNGDGVDDIITGAGPNGGPHVRVFDGTNLTELRSFMAYPTTFTGGVYVAAGDLDGDGKADIVTGSGGGMVATVNLYNGATGAQFGTVMQPYGLSFDGGASVAVGDVTGDGHADVITGAGPTGGPHVQVFSGVALAGPPVFSFMAYATTFTGGIYVAAGDVTGLGRAEIITGPGPLAGVGTLSAPGAVGPDVRVFDGLNAAVPLRDFLAYASSFSGGESIKVKDVDGDGKADIITGAGPTGGPHVRVFSGAIAGLELRSFFAFDPGFLGGVFVG